MPTVPYPNQVQVALSDFLGAQPYVGLTGAVADCRQCSDAAIEPDSTTLTSATADWGLGESGTEWGLPLAGKFIAVQGAGVDGADLITTIASWTDSGTLELTDAASTLVTGSAHCIWGTDNTTALQEAFDTYASKKVILRLHFGDYLTGRLTIPSNLHLVGSGPQASRLLYKPGSSINNYAMLETYGIDTPLPDPYAPLVENIIFENLGIDGLGGFSQLYGGSDGNGDGSHSWHPTQHMSLMFIWWSKNCRFENCRFENGNVGGVNIGGAFENISFINCHFEDATVPGNTFTKYDFSESYVDENGRGKVMMNGALLRIWDCETSSKGWHVTGCRFHAHTCQGTCVKAGIDFLAADTGQVLSDLSITNNEFLMGTVEWHENNSGEQVLDGPGRGQTGALGFEIWSPTGMVVTGNRFETVDLTGQDRRNDNFAISVIRAYAHGTHAVISNNTITNCGAYTVECNVPYSVISNNICRRSGAMSIIGGSYASQSLGIGNITVANNTFEYPRLGSNSFASAYPVRAISVYNGAIEDGPKIDNVQIIGNIFRLSQVEEPGPPGWPQSIYAIDVFVNSTFAGTIENCCIRDNIIYGTGGTKENGISVGTIPGNAILRKIFLEGNILNNLNIGIAFSDGVVDSRCYFNSVDENTVTIPYQGSMVGADADNVLAEYTSDISGFGSGKDPKHLSSRSFKVYGQQYPVLRSDGCVQLPARLGYEGRAYFSSPPGVVNMSNIIAINSVGNSPFQGGWISVNSWRKSGEEWEQTSKLYDFTISGTTVTITGTGEAVDPQDGDTMYVTGFDGTGLSDYTRYTVANVSDGSPYTLELQIDSVSQSGSGSGKLSDSPYALFLQIAPEMFGLGFGKASQLGSPYDPTNPFEDSIWGPSLRVVSANNNVNWLPGVYSAYPIYPDFNYSAGIRCYNGSPENELDGSQGMLCLDTQSGIGGQPAHLWVKTSALGTLTGWVDLGPGAGAWVIVGDSVVTAYRVLVTDPTNSRAVGVTVTPTTHINQAATPAFSSTGFAVDYHGNTTVESFGCGTAAPGETGYGVFNTWLGVAINDQAGSEVFNCNGEATIVSATIGDTVVNGSLSLTAQTASRAALINSSNQVVAGLIDLSSNDHIVNVLPLGYGGTGGTSAVTARASLDVYSKAEANALLANKSNVSHSHSTSSDGAHTHETEVPEDGTHTHTVS